MAMEGPREAMHGLMGEAHWQPPVIVTEYDTKARHTFTDISASEFGDVEEVLREKVALLATLVKRSDAMVAYTGAGISTAAGIDDYATRAKDESVTAEGRPEVKDWKDARPTRAHFAMVELYKASMLKYWIQQNHDSLPQKAGFPQHALNEIHGSLHDPSNPVVPYEGSLRDDLFEWMHHWQDKADLCLALGTSLSGFNADSVPAAAAKRFAGGCGQGLVIVNLQNTPYDAQCSLRIYAKIDTVLEMLVSQLGLELMDEQAPAAFMEVPAGAVIGEDIFQIPFCPKTGRRRDGKESATWDLRVGAHVKLLAGPYKDDVGIVMERSPEGHYRMRFEDSVNPTLRMMRKPFSLWLGRWWIVESAKGLTVCPGAPVPFINVSQEEFDSVRSANQAEVSAAVDRGKYARMLKAGLPPHVVEMQMTRDGVPGPLPAIDASSD
eukprot:TRINITY_DN25152_c0_g3_i1.p1 TRINITY_DN25152_c0_g3~~TRINITY_DN25152_c0_g3_i1.p1  ORF type:complete len:437 (-),score=74.65 TRINITY_DN25152_c0_g3_i1:477-1787(-)